MSDALSSFRLYHGIILGALAALALLTWPGGDGDLAFWVYQLALIAVLLAGHEFRQSYMMPAADGSWGAPDRLHVALVQGTFFAALILILQAPGALAAPAGWLVSGVLAGAFFGGLSAIDGLFPPIRAPERLDAFARDRARTDERRERIRLYLMPVLLIGVAPLFIIEAGLLPPQTGLPVFMLFAAAVAEPAPKFPRTDFAETGALWTLRRHLVLKFVAIGLLAVLLLR